MDKREPEKRGGVRFWLALWAAKLSVPVLKLTRHNGTHFPGSLAMRICPDFLRRLSKPEKIVAVTGTNGKTTSTNLICGMLRARGLRVLSNTLGSNMYAGVATALMEGVSVFNRCHSDMAVLEVDERSARYIFAHVKPQFLAVTNITRDSIQRNAHQEYIFDLVNLGISYTPETVLILNADDPVSSFLGETFGGGEGAFPNRRVYYGIADQGQDAFLPGVPDFSVCPKCGGKPEFSYRLYRTIGQFHCPKCGTSSKERDYTGLRLDFENRRLTVEDRSGARFDCPLPSDSIFNAYNTMMIVALFGEMGYSRQETARLLGEAQITDRRFTLETAGGINLYTYAAKGQNGSAISSVFEYLAKDPSKKEVVVMLYEHFGDTLTWLYESDFEYLDQENISKIILTGNRYLDCELRMKLAGIPAEKIVCLEDETRVPEYVDTEGIESVYFLHDVYCMEKTMRCRQLVKKRILGGDGHEN